MPRQSQDETLIQIEAAQETLRDSIEQAKDLAAESERRIRRHRTVKAGPEPAEPARRGARRDL